MEIQTAYRTYCKRIIDQNPLIHHITNLVTMNDCANMTLAIGSSPIMANDPNEAADITSLANTLVLNMGTPSENGMIAMKKAVQVARRKKVPILFDPVGVGSTAFRRKAASSLLEEETVTVIRGNASEIKSLAGLEGQGKGVDAGVGLEGMVEEAARLAKRLKTIVAVTGETDLITNGEKVIQLFHGHPILARVTGTGCMTNSLIAAFLSVTKDPLEATVMGILTMSIAGERAAASLTQNEGPGTFRMRLFDHVHLLSQEPDLGRVQYNEYTIDSD